MRVRPYHVPDRKPFKKCASATLCGTKHVVSVATDTVAISAGCVLEVVSHRRVHVKVTLLSQLTSTLYSNYS